MNSQKLSQRTITDRVGAGDFFPILRRGAPAGQDQNPTVPFSVLLAAIKAGSPVPASVVVFNPTGPDLKQGDRVLYEINGKSRQFAARPAGGLKKADFGGTLPAPSAAGSDANYLEIPIGGDGYAPVVVVGYYTASDEMDGSRLLPGKYYYIIRDAPKPPVLVMATGQGSFSPVAWQDPEAVFPDKPVFGTYDVQADEFAPLNIEALTAIVSPTQVMSGNGYAGYDGLDDVAALGTVDDAILELTQDIIPNNQPNTINGLTWHGKGRTVLLSASLSIAGAGSVNNVVFQRSSGNAAQLDINSTALFKCRVISQDPDPFLFVAAGQVVRAEYCDLDCAPAIEGTLVLNPGTTVSPSFLDSLTDNGNGTYTAPAGGLVQDNRCVVPGPGGALYRQFITTPGGVVTNNYVLL